MEENKENETQEIQVKEENKGIDSADSSQIYQQSYRPSQSNNTNNFHQNNDYNHDYVNFDDRNYNNQPQRSNQSTGQSKKSMGALLCLVLGFIGLVIGMCMYDSKSYERETFVQGWLTCFFVELGACVILFFILLIVQFSISY